MAEGAEEQRERPHLPRQRDARRRRSTAARRELGVINHYYWYRLRDELGAAKIHSAEHFFAPGDPGYVIDVSGAGILASSTHQAEAQQFLAFLVSKQGQEILAHDESYEYPLGSGVVTRQAARAVRARCGPTRSRSAQLGDGQARDRACCATPGLL